MRRPLTAALSCCAALAVAAPLPADVVDWEPFNPTFVPVGDWSLDALWEGADIPDPDDIAAFPSWDDPYTCLVDVSPTVLGVFQTGPDSLVDFLAGRTLTIVDDPTDVDGFYVMQAGRTWLRSSDLVILDDVNGGGSVDLQGGVFSVLGSSTVDAPVLVRAPGTFEVLGQPGISSTVTHVKDVVVEGTYVLDSVANGFAMAQGDGMILVEPTGALDLRANGSSLVRYLRLDVTSHGTVVVEPAAQVRHDAAGTQLRLEDGTLTIGPGATLTNGSVSNELVVQGTDIVNDGQLIHLGATATVTDGSITGNPIEVQNTDLVTGPTPTFDGTIAFQGSGVHSGDVGPAMTLLVQGIPGLSATLDGGDTLVEGRLELDSTSNGFATFTAPGSLLDVTGELVLGGNGTALERRIRADLLNRGSVLAATNALVRLDEAGALYENTATFEVQPLADVWNGASSGTFRQSAGVLMNDGTFRWTNGTFEWLGGDLTGNAVELTATDLVFGPASTGVGDVVGRGGFDLTGSIAADQTLTILGIPGLSATATMTGDTVVDGLLVMDATSNGFSQLLGPGDVLPQLTITELGMLDLGGGGSAIQRYLRTDTLNLGELVVRDLADAYFDQGGRVLETDGTLVVEPDGLLTNNGASSTLRSVGGVLDNQGSVQWTNGSIEWLGGDLLGNELFTTGTNHVIGPGATGTFAVNAGGNAALTGDVAPAQRVTIAGRPGLSATMRLLDDVTVHGRLELVSSSNGFATVSSLADDDFLLEIAPDGTLEALPGGSVIDRVLATDVLVTGTAIARDGANLRCNVDRLLTLDGSLLVEDGALFAGTANADFAMLGGTLDVAGTCTWNSGDWTLAGGTITGNPPDLSGITLTTVPTDTGTSATVRMWSTNNLIGSVTKDLVILLEGRPGVAATLTVEEGATIAGTVELRTTSNGSSGIRTLGGTTEPLMVDGTLVARAGGSTPLRTVQNMPAVVRGLAEVETGAILRTNGYPIDAEGTVRVDGTLSNFGPAVTFGIAPGGRLEGSGTLDAGFGAVASLGTTAPAGASEIGTLTVAGDYDQSVVGTLEIDLGDGESDVLAVGGVAMLDGLLDLRLAGGVAPKVGTTWTILTCDERVGTFADVTCAGAFQVNYFDDRVEVTVISAPVFGDLNCDGFVNFSDLLILLAEWGPCPGCTSDLDGDGTTGFGDLLILLANWS